VLKLIIFISLFLLPAFAQTNFDRLSALKVLKRIAFGSCNHQNKEQPLWNDIIQNHPDLWIWGGDNIYADMGKSDSILFAYQKQNENKDYTLLKSQIPFIGTWDDHDYGLNNANGELAFKKRSQKFHLDFFEVPEDSPRRLQEGIYTSHEFGEGDKIVKIIILDNRYFKDLDKEAPILGNQQWLWLENELRKSKASLHFLVMGISIFSPPIPYAEDWNQSRGERERLKILLSTYKVKAPIFLTGDKHFSSIFMRSGQLEFMSSGLTHTPPRYTWWYVARKYPVTYFGLSYGIIDIDWKDSNPSLMVFIRNGKKDIHKTRATWKDHAWSIKRI